MITRQRQLIADAKYMRIFMPALSAFFTVSIALAQSAESTTQQVSKSAGTTQFLKVSKVYVSPDRTIGPMNLIMREGRLDQIGEALEVPDGATVHDFAESVVTAGLIDASVSAAAFRHYKGPEHASECTPELRVIDGLDRDDPFLRELAAGGVTTVYVGPEPSAVIGPRGVVLKTGGPVQQRIVEPAQSIKITIGREPIYRQGWNDEPWGTVTYTTRRPTTRMGLIWTIRKSFHDARALSRGESPGTRGDSSPSDAAIPFLQQALKSEPPPRIQARKQLDILSALRIAEEFDFRFILEEGTDAARCASELKSHDIPVIYGPIFDYPAGYRQSSEEVERHRYSTLAELVKAGLQVALTAGDMTGEAALARQAGYAMRMGLSRAEALAVVTTIPASLLGMEQGGIINTDEPGDLVVWSGEPFDAGTRPLLVVINGEVVFRHVSD